jgi:hypothetical protein
MPLLGVHVYPLLIVASAGVTGVALVWFLGTRACRKFGYTVPFLSHDEPIEHRHCRYCFLGRAHLHDESLRLEGDDLVEVKCFVCKACGLPQWSVARSPVLRRAA